MLSQKQKQEAAEAELSAEEKRKVGYNLHVFINVVVKCLLCFFYFRLKKKGEKLNRKRFKQRLLPCYRRLPSNGRTELLRN